MAIRVWGLLFIMAAVVGVLFLAPAPATAQSAAAKAIPRLPDGKPDFNGVWARPRVADITRDATGCGSGTQGCTQKGSGPLPFTALGEQLNKAPKFDYTAFCLPWGYTRSMQTEYPLEIIQTPRRLAYLYESNNIFHVIPTDGRQLPRDIEPSWMGESVGRYDGDTLVIDTRGFNGKTTLDVGAEHPTSAALHIVERIRHIDADHLAYDITIEDETILTKPVTNSRTWVRMKPGEELMEYFCMENNKDLLDGHLDHLRDEAYRKFFGLDQ
ncbi:MAG: hypothetical protein DMG13_12440 [Acidobacteria bacterium]|nr:MAG: hypothetical protein DMG13_12440 [Acidobacteriota bacterium]